jgi:matrixin
MSRSFVALAGVLLLLVQVAPVSAKPVLHVEETRMGAAQTASTAVTTAANACTDSAYKLEGGARWQGTLNWWFKASSTPASLTASSVQDTIQRAFGNVTGARNDCGLGDNVSASALFKGPTSRSPKCGSNDGYNVVGFGSLPTNTLAVTCYWFMGNKMIEADIKINSSVVWALALAGCTGSKTILEGTMTHEVGHAFGLGHVGESNHRLLTMSPIINGVCQNSESTLGLGDVRGLEALY